MFLSSVKTFRVIIRRKDKKQKIINLTKLRDILTRVIELFEQLDLILGTLDCSYFFLFFSEDIAVGQAWVLS